MRTFCLYNPAAGRFSEGRLARAFRGRAFWGEVEYHALGAGRDGWSGRIAAGDKAVVLGGDGTVHHVIQRLAGSGVELSVLPAGTANDLGYCLGLAGGLPRAMDLLEAGRTVGYDTIAVNGRHVITGGGFGLGYQAAASANRLRRGALGPLFRMLRAKIYLLTLGWHGLVAPPPRVQVRVRAGGEATEGGTQSILFCNQALMGKRVLIAPGTTGTDGRFHLLQFLHADTRGILGCLAGLKVGASGSDRQPAPDPRVRRLETDRAEIEFAEAVPAYGDGEELAPSRRWELECRPGSVRLRVPAAFGSGAC